MNGSGRPFLCHTNTFNYIGSGVATPGPVPMWFTHPGYATVYIGLLLLCPIRHLDCSGVTHCFAILPASVGKVGTAGEWDEFGDEGTSSWRKTKVRTKQTITHDKRHNSEWLFVVCIKLYFVTYLLVLQYTSVLSFQPQCSLPSVEELEPHLSMRNWVCVAAIGKKFSASIHHNLHLGSSSQSCLAHSLVHQGWVPVYASQKHWPAHCKGSSHLVSLQLIIRWLLVIKVTSAKVTDVTHLDRECKRNGNCEVKQCLHLFISS